jgi:transcriptional regulator with XRE-family HTH domain
MPDQPAARKPGHTREGNLPPPQNRPLLPERSGEGNVVGPRLREIRTSRKFSLRTLADLSGLNVNTLSLIEHGRSSPSVSTLQHLAHSLQVPITEFFQANHTGRQLVHQRNGQRRSVAFEHSMMEDLADGMPRFGAEPIIVTLKPGAGCGDKPVVHTGREFVYCLHGRIVYTVDGGKYLLEAGDSLVFEAYLPHHWKNIGAEPSQALLVLCPMDERDRPTERHFAL